MIWLLSSSVPIKRCIMLLLHYKAHWEQHDHRNSSRVSTTDQGLVITCQPSCDLRLAFRLHSKPKRSDLGECTTAPATHYPRSTDQTTSAYKTRLFAIRASYPLYQILEAIHSYRPTGNTSSLTPGIISLALAA